MDLFIQREITRASKTTVTTPAEVPKSRTDVKTKVSETEILAGREGTFTVKDPVSSVRVASKNHSTPGWETDNCQIDATSTTEPKLVTTPIYQSCSWRSAKEPLPADRLSAYSPQTISLAIASSY